VRAGVQVDVITTDDDGPGRHLAVTLGERIERDGYGTFHFRKQTEFYKVSLPFRRWVRQHARDYDLIHIHALFSFTSIAAAHAARRAGVPYLIRPLGVLNRWGMDNRRRLLKRLSFRFLETPILNHAVAMHYTARAEQVEAEQSGATARAAVVPLGINVDHFVALPTAEKFFDKFPQAKGRDVVLFLSRVDSKKGFDLLLPAFAKVHARFPDSLLVIAGDGEAAYVSALRAQTAQLGIARDVLWAGFLGGADKLAVFAAATVFTLPSYSENFGIALVEALAAGLACVTTDGVAVSVDVRARDAGIVVPCEIAALADALESMLGNASLRTKFSANARRLALERFSLNAMGQGLVELYTSILIAPPGAASRLELET